MTVTRNSRILRTIPLVLIMAVLCPFAYGKIIYVDDDATGANDGSSWASTYIYLQDALADANDSDKPVEIRVAQGIYRPNQGLMAIPEFDWRTTTFQLINGVTLKGGYAGFGEHDPNAHDIEIYETILSGDLNGDDIEVVDPCDLSTEPTRAENSRHVVTGSGTDVTTIMDGFTITAGNADGPSWQETHGGGLRNMSGHPTITNCTFVGNTALRRGGGMYNVSSNPILTDCRFIANAALHGGGICNHSSSPEMNGCKFNNNVAENGGGLSNTHGSPTLTNCTFNGNLATAFGGGIRNFNSSNLTISDCIFTSNTAEDQGGGMFNQETSPIISNCIFTGNRAGYGGGGMENFIESCPTVINCTFTDNIAGNLGGGMYNNNAAPTVTNCLFSGNWAIFWGGGMENFFDSLPVVTNCTFSGNKAGANGGGMYSHMNCTIVLTNCILWYNMAPDAPEVSDDPNSSITVNYSNVQGGFPGEGNIDADPLFAVLGYLDENGTPGDNSDDYWVDGDYHLKSQAGRFDPNSQTWVVDDVTSPCIDAGDPLTPVMYEPFPRGCIINMGAYGGTEKASKSPFDCLYEPVGSGE